MNATAARQLVPLIGRARTFRAALVPLLVAALLGWTGYFILAARHLSPEQSAVAAYGSSNGSTEATAPIPGERFSPLRASVGAARIDADALSSDVQWAGDGGAWFAMYVEQPYPNPSTEGRLVLDGGRWPRRPGEVVASPGLGLSRGTVVRAARGRWNLTVVGTLRDVWQPDARSLYGAPGTWNRWEISRDQARVTGASPARTVYWSASEPMQAAPEVERAAGAAPLSRSDSASSSPVSRTGCGPRRSPKDVMSSIQAPPADSDAVRSRRPAPIRSNALVLDRRAVR